MRALPLADRLAVASQRRLSRLLVAGGRQVRAYNANHGDALAAPALQLAERAFFSYGRRAGARARTRMKAAKRRATIARNAARDAARDAAREGADRNDGVSPRHAKVTDLRALVSERHAAETGRARRELALLAAGNDPVIVGPFFGEVGFELLYWGPFVKWALREFPRLHGRLIVAARGGTRTWYGEGIRDYVDVLDVFTPEEFAERRRDYKQRDARPLDREFLSAVTERLGLREPKLLEPGLMWSGYYSAIKTDERSYVGAVRGAAPDANEPLFGLRSLYTPIPAPPLGELEDALPREFVAARFYFSPAFPDTAENRDFATWLLTALSERIPVVLLNNGLELDDHVDVDLGSPRIITIEDRMTPANNLHVQTTVIAHARAFAGTYGGLAYLPPHLGVPSLAFLGGGPAPFPRHLELAQQVFRGPPWGSLAVLTTRDLALLELLVGVHSAATTP